MRNNIKKNNTDLNKKQSKLFVPHGGEGYLASDCGFQAALSSL